MIRLLFFVATMVVTSIVSADEIGAVFLLDTGASCSPIRNKRVEIFRIRNARRVLPEKVGEERTDNEGTITTEVLKKGNGSYRFKVELGPGPAGNNGWLHFDINEVKTILVLRTARRPVVYNNVGEPIAELGELLLAEESARYTPPRRPTSQYGGSTLAIPATRYYQIQSLSFPCPPPAFPVFDPCSCYP